MEANRKKGFFAWLWKRPDVGMYVTAMFSIAALVAQISAAIALDTAIFGPSSPGVQAGPYEVLFGIASILTILANTVYLVCWFLSKK